MLMREIKHDIIDKATASRFAEVRRDVSPTKTPPFRNTSELTDKMNCEASGP